MHSRYTFCKKPLSIHYMYVSTEHQLIPMQMNQKFQEIGFILTMCDALHQFLLLAIPFYSNLQCDVSGMPLKDDYLTCERHGMDLSLPANQ